MEEKAALWLRSDEVLKEEDDEETTEGFDKDEVTVEVDVCACAVEEDREDDVGL
jgi:hypothetical protein